MTAAIEPKVRQFVIASYLMGKQQAAGLELCCTQCYGIAAYFDEYAAAVGHPLSDGGADDGGPTLATKPTEISRREYSSSTVLVNAYNAGGTDHGVDVTVALAQLPTGMHYEDLYGKKYTSGSITLPPQTGAVLLHKESKGNVAPIDWATAVPKLKHDDAYAASTPPSLRLLLALLLPTSSGALSLFMRTSWLAEVPEPVWRSWFELIARGRREGPASPFYVAELGLQNTACCEGHPTARGCLGPKCSDLGLPPNSLLTKQLDAMSEYFPLFDKVHVGTTADMNSNWNGKENASSTKAYAELQGRVGSEFMARYGKLPNVSYGWYLTSEGSVSSIGLSAAEQSSWGRYLNESMDALHAVDPALTFLWSPSNGGITPTPAQRVQEEAGLTSMLCHLSHPIAVHFQDWLGQSVSFEFPFYYNYSVAFTVEKDTAPTYALLQRIHKACPSKLREVKVNAELFAERLNHGQHGEDNGANIVNADPREVATRLSLYKKGAMDVGCCWAINHWWSLMTYANATVYSPYDTKALKHDDAAAVDPFCSDAAHDAEHFGGKLLEGMCSSSPCNA